MSLSLALESPMKPFAVLCVLLSLSAYAKDIVVGGETITLTPIPDRVVTWDLTTAEPQPDATEQRTAPTGHEVANIRCRFTDQGNLYRNVAVILEKNALTRTDEVVTYQAAFIVGDVKYTGDKKVVTVSYAPRSPDDISVGRYSFQLLYAQIDFDGQVRWYFEIDGKTGKGLLVSGASKRGVAKPAYQADCNVVL